jgi:hypothetical protein
MRLFQARAAIVWLIVTECRVQNKPDNEHDGISSCTEDFLSEWRDRLTRTQTCRLTYHVVRNTEGRNCWTESSESAH